MSITDNWIHSFTVTDTCRHTDGYTIYKITSVVFPVTVPEALTHITVWKRFNEVKKLLKYVQNRHAVLGLRGDIPDIKSNSYFQRFHPDTISKRKLFILELLDYISQHSVLYKSHVFQLFFENGDHLERNEFEQKINQKQAEENVGDKTVSKSFSIFRKKHKDGVLVNRQVESNEVKDDDNSIKPTIAKPINGHVNTSTDLVDSPNSSDIKLDENMEYFYEAASEFSYGGRAEENNRLKEAFERYKRGVDILLRGSKNDNSNKIKAKKYAIEYMARAETVLKKIETRSSMIENNGNRKSIPFGYQRNINELAKIKVIQILGSVMQVQDVSNNHIYIMKVIQKDAEDDELYYPKNIPYMVNLVAYYKSDISIFLLLEYASGRRLCDYIQSYKFNLALEVTQKSQLEEAREQSSDDSSPTNSPITSIEVEISASDTDKFALATENEATTVLPANTRTATTSDDKPTSRPPNEFISNKLQPNNNCSQLKSACSNENQFIDLNLEKFALPEMTMKRWFSEIIEALHNLHRENIYCFDLHPNNVLLGARGEILLSYFYKNLQPNSFNSIKLDATEQQLSAYIAPERPLNKCSDWWSAGIIFFELFTGHTYESCHPSGANFYFEIQYPDGIDAGTDLDSLLHGMIEPDPDARLTLSEIKSHPFFKEIQWNI